MTCGWCDGLLTGRQIMWCSENCRKRAADDAKRRTCPDCGGRMSTYSSWGKRSDARCRACRDRREAMAHRARLEDVAVMYREGLSIREIAQELGYGPNSKPPHLTECFKLGLLRPDEYRYPADRRENAHDARWAA